MFVVFAIVSIVVLACAFHFSRTNEVDVGKELERMREKYMAEDRTTSSGASVSELEGILSVLAGTEGQAESDSSDAHEDPGTSYGEFDPLSQSAFHEDYGSA